MPYRNAHYYLLLLILLAGLAFWPMYLSVLPSKSLAIHIHSFSATLWIALLAFQSWSIHHRRNQWHRAVGIASLTIFPFLFAGSVLITHTIAWNFAAGELFDGLFGARFATIDFVAISAIAFMFWSGLHWRRKVHLHARYMFATTFFLLEPIFARLLAQFVPGLQLTPPAFANLPTNIELASLIALILALALAWKEPKYARPWLITAVLIGLQMVFFFTLGMFGPWEALVRSFAGLPPLILFSSGIVVGAFVSWHGWKSIPPRVAGAGVLGTADA